MTNDINPSDEIPEVVGQCRKPDPSVYPFLMIQMHTGLRVCEVLDLKGLSVDVPAGTLAIVSPKTMTTRVVTITPEVARMLTSYLKTRRGVRVASVKKLGRTYRNRVRHLRSRGRR